MSRDHHDALIEQLLREAMGGDRPRDLTARVMTLAQVHDRSRRTWWIGAGAAMAACIALAVSLWMFWPRAYPAPVTEDLALVNGGDVQPGAQLTSAFDRPGKMRVGGYVDMVVAPNTTFTVGGRPFREMVYLDQGRLDVAVTKKRGTFDIVVGPAKVHVTGTKFDVEVTRGINEAEAQIEKRLRVHVQEGGVEVEGLEKTPHAVTAGMTAEFTISSDPLALPPQVEMPDLLELPAGPAALSPTTAETPITASPLAYEAGTSPASTPSATAVGPNARIANARATRVSPKFAPMIVIVGPGPYEFDGIYQRLGAYRVLWTGRAYLMLDTADDLPPNAANVANNARVHVRFARGKVLSIEPRPAASRGATTRGGGARQGDK